MENMHSIYCGVKGRETCTIHDELDNEQFESKN